MSTPQEAQEAMAAVAAELRAAAPGELPAPSSARALGQWLAEPGILMAPRTVIPHLAIAGRVSLLSGREKIGKSTLAACAAACASRGADVLGAPIDAPVSTLWFALDEHVADAVRRFERLGADATRVLINDRPRTVGELRLALESDLAAFPAVRCVVLDTLSRVLGASGVDANDARQVEPVIASLVDVFHQSGVAAILLYHTGKGGREYRGSTALGASVDEILTLRQRDAAADTDDFDDDGPADGRRLLVQDGRNLRGRMHLTCTAGLYDLHDGTSAPRERILAVVSEQGEARSRSELVKLAGLRKTAGLHAVAELVASGCLVETGGRLTLPRFPTPGTEALKTPFREPAPTHPGSAGSRRFPEGGTGREPIREPGRPAPAAPVPGSGTPPLQKREPAQSARPTAPAGGDPPLPDDVHPDALRWLTL